MSQVSSTTRVIIDTGASENAVGSESLRRLIEDSGFDHTVNVLDRPVFKFGNGLKSRATCRVDLHDTAIGPLSFYVLGDSAKETPLLLGGKTLRELDALMAYQNDLFIYKAQNSEVPSWFAVQMQQHPSSHVSIDLTEEAHAMEMSNFNFLLKAVGGGKKNIQLASIVAEHCNCVFMMSDERPHENLQHRLSSLAQRLHHLRDQADHGCSRGMCSRRPSQNGLSLLSETQGKDKKQPIRELEHLHAMRAAVELSGSEGLRRTLSSDGTTPTAHPGGNGAIGVPDGCESDHRESGQWEANGTQGASVATRLDADDGDQHELGSLPQENGPRATLQTEISNEKAGRDINSIDGGTINTVAFDSGIFPGGDGAGSNSHPQDDESREGSAGARDRQVPEVNSEEAEPRASAMAEVGRHPQGSAEHLFGRGEGGNQGEGIGINRAQCARSDEGRELGEEEPGTLRGTLSSLRQRLWSLTRSMQRPSESTTSTTNTSALLGASRHGVSKDTIDCAVQMVGTSTENQPGNSLNVVEHDLPQCGPGGGKRKGVPPNTARRLASSMAVLGAMITAPVHGLFGQLSNQPDFMEIACAPESALSQRLIDKGYFCQRINFQEGFDLEKREGTLRLSEAIQKSPPKHSWVSLPCTRLSSLTNLTQRDELEQANFEKRVCRDLKRADEVVDAVDPVLASGGDVSWEWPTGAVRGWKSRAIRRLQAKIKFYNRHAFWCVFHGCAYGLEYKGWPVMKSWTVLTTSRHVWLALQRRCPGPEVHDHVHCRGVVAQASSYYPDQMVRAITEAITKSWHYMEDEAKTSLAKGVEIYMLGASSYDTENDIGITLDTETADWRHYEQLVLEEQPEVFALTRTRYPQEAPVGRRLEQIKAQMLRIHRASGHSSMASLQRLLRARQAPEWAIDLAGSIKCPDCVEAKLPVPAPVASLHETPGLMEIIGSDIFEFEAEVYKYKMMLIRDRASGFVMVETMRQYSGPEGPTNWEPNTTEVLKVFSKWMMTNPAPKWILTDSATYFTSQEMMDFAGRSGIGLLTTPAEAHQMLGAEEGCIRILKCTVQTLLKEEPTMDIDLAFNLAAHGHNQAIGPSGFSPFQWVRGTSAPIDNIPFGIDPRKAFGGMLRLKEKAKVAFEMESAKARLSKLNNSIPRASASYKQGQLVMLWRQKNRPGKVSGSWIGPVRMLLQEGHTLWLATGATLIRARVQQVRPCTRREELRSTLEGTAVLQLPVTLESLLQSFTGRHFSDVTGDVPSLEQMQDDVVGAEVRAVPRSGFRPDSWKIVEEDGKRWMVRVHTLPRLALFTPSRTTTMPYAEEDLTGARKTKIRGLQGDSPEVAIEDDYKTAHDPNRALQERWLGETWLEIKESAKPSGPPSKARRANPKSGTKRKKQFEGSEAEAPVAGQKKREPQVNIDEERAHLDDQPVAIDASQGATTALSSSSGVMIPNVVGISPLALQGSEAAAVNGVPASEDLSRTSSCPVDACTLPGGHGGAHQDDRGARFNWSQTYGRVNVESSSSSDSSSDSDSSSSDEMIRDGAVLHNEVETKTKDCFYVLEIEIGPADTAYLTKNPHKSSIWLSRKMQEKGKEMRWSQMTMEQKQNYDLAMAKELSNVLSSKALRSLTAQEYLNLDFKKVMQMRWVLTMKSDGTSKARLVVLGFQAPNITEVQTAAPTMAKVSRSLILTIAANRGFKLKAGDVTSAFLQTMQSLEDENLVVWSPAELATLFGADPHHPVMPLKVAKAFYGLVHAPRHWFQDVSATMRKHGWKNILADQCVFVLYSTEGDLIAIAGLHVDDFLLAGQEDHPQYKEAEKNLMSAYRWGKWEENEMEFAGCNIKQMPDKSIRIDQQTYVDRWLEEIPLSAHRAREVKSSLTPSEVSQLRGLIGTLSWKATQTGPHYQADTSMLLSEIPYATVNTILKANKLIREVKRESQQFLLFPNWNCPWEDIAIVTWCDAGNHNRPDRSSTLGMISGAVPKDFLEGQERAVAILHWRSSKTPRQCLGSNGAEVQSITEGEDSNFKLRAMWTEIHGVPLARGNIYQQVRDHVAGALVMDTRGIYDAMVRNISSLHGLRSSRAGYELTLAVQQALQLRTSLRWVNGLAQLADCLTKAAERKVFLQFLSQRQQWRLIHDEKFVAGKKLKKRELEEAIKRQEFFVQTLESWAVANKWPWEVDQESRNRGDVDSEHVMSPRCLDHVDS